MEISGQLHISSRSTARETVLSTLRTRGWVGLKASMDGGLGEEKICCPSRELNDDSSVVELVLQ
jgi:hypothetical protein